MARAPAFPLRAGKTGRIDEGAVQFAAGQEAFLEEAIESGHDGGVRERTAEPGNHLADPAFAAQPENLHQFQLESAKARGLNLAGAPRNAIFEVAH